MVCNILSINIISAAMGAIAIYYFCYSNYKVNLNILKIFIFSITFGLVNGFLSSYLLNSGVLLNVMKPVALFASSVFLITVCLRTKVFQALISFCIYSLCLAVGNSITPLLINISSNEFTTNNMLNNPSDLLLVNMICNLTAFLVIFAVKPFREFISKMLIKKEVLPILFFTFLVLTANSGMHFYIQIFNLTAYIIISILSILYCIYAIYISTKLVKHETSRLEIEQQKFYNESLNSTIFNLRRFKHDWNNNLTVINSMLRMNKMNELKQYLSELMNQNLDENNTEIYNIKNAGLFGIISAKLNQARDMGVHVDLSVVGEIESIPGIKISELCEIVGIFFDNAIEEAAKCEKIINVNLYNSDNFIELSISNHCISIPDLKKIYEVGYSSKGENRGMGLAIAQKIVTKYKNVLHSTDFENQLFTQIITIEKG